MLRCVLLALCLGTSSAQAEMLGWSLSHTNDALGDQFDRWRTAEVQGSLVFSDAWTGALPAAPGVLTEVRTRAEILSPAHIGNPDPRDRRYAALLSVGVHTHWAVGKTDWAVGTDLIALGPQTGLRGVQTVLHEILGFPEPRVDGFQIQNDLRLGFSAEAGRSLAVGPQARIRPFMAVDMGLETLVRAGADVDIGAFGTGELRIRQVASGHRLSVIRDPDATGLRFTFGADAAWVVDSALLPVRRKVSPRYRVRFGAEQRGSAGRVFYGLTWLGEEFQNQTEGQFVGTLALRLRF